MLVLDIEWMTGTARLASDPSDPAPDWPAQPDRVFSALVASWGALGTPRNARAALEWMERQPPPEIWCVPPGDVTTRAAPDVYVPVNDPKGIDLLPQRRSRQKRSFQVCVLPDQPLHQQIVWAEAPSPETLSALNSLAEATSYIGHSASLARLLFKTMDAPGPDAALERATTRSAPHPGRLAALEGLHERHLQGDARARARPAPVKLPSPPPVQRSNVFTPDWYVLGHAGGDRPDILACAGVTRRLRDALMSAVPDPVPPWLSGHEPDGSPTRQPHLSIVPLAFVGNEHATGRLMGLGIVLPAAVRSRWDDGSPAVWKERRDFEGALARLMSENPDGEQAVGGQALALRLGPAGVWKLELRPQPSQASLRPDRYVASACVWHSVTPIALDRHLKGKDTEWRDEAAGIVADACLNTGLARPSHVEVFKHSAARGVPAAWPVGGAPRRPDWARPGFLKQRKLVHARIVFSEPVEGPVIVGAGRFAGLGLCLPASSQDEGHA